MLLLSSCRNILATVQASVAICAVILGDPSISGASDDNTANNSAATMVRLRSCSPSSNCVSSNYKEPPNRYISPLRIVNNRDTAFQRAIRDLKQYSGEAFSLVEIVPKDYYIHLTVPGTAPSSLDDLELIFTDSIVNVKCEARVTLPPPPFCIKKNCINGNMDQRSRVENLAFNVLGLPASDREAMKGAKWTPIFMNSDRVPGFDDEF
jgi:uncharacterized protein (DUF1499 family)